MLNFIFSAPVKNILEFLYIRFSVCKSRLSCCHARAGVRMSAGRGVTAFPRTKKIQQFIQAIHSTTILNPAGIFNWFSSFFVLNLSRGILFRPAAARVGR
jgi:hypothetical protein